MMVVSKLEKYLIVLILLSLTHAGFGQGSVPVGVNYQAVARDNNGKELISKNIDVKFSILSGNPLGTLVYQELHSGVTTSKFGVFSLIIGKGVITGGTAGNLLQVNWSQALHYLKVEVKFDNNFIEMGTMQFLSVPYALYAQKSLEPGPQGTKGETGAQGLQGLQGTQGQKGDPGPQGLKGDTGPLGPQGVQGQKGDPGDPASDIQTLSFNGENLSISVGNAGAVSTVNLSSLNVPHVLSINGDTVSITGGSKITLPNETQDLSISDNFLSVSKSKAPGVDLTRFLDDKQQLSFNNADSTLSITNSTNPPIDLSIFNQSLSFNTTTNMLSISGNSHPVDLTLLRNDPDSDPANEIQDLSLTGNVLSLSKSTPTINLAPYLDDTDNQTITYNPATYSLTISNSGSTAVLGSMIAFRARKTTPETGLSNLDYDFITPFVDYNEGSGFDGTLGVFTAPTGGIYTFIVGFNASTLDDTKALKISLNGTIYEILNSGIISRSSLTRSITMKLVTGDKIKVIVNPGLSTESGTGSFSGYRVY